MNASNGHLRCATADEAPADPLDVNLLSLRGEAYAHGQRAEDAKAVMRELGSQYRGIRWAEAQVQRISAILHGIEGDGAAAVRCSLAAAEILCEHDALESDRALIEAHEYEAELNPDGTQLRVLLERSEARPSAHFAERCRLALRRRGFRLARKAPPRRGPLSDRELEVARLAAKGLSKAAIAKALFISPHTVGTHIKKIYTRLEINSRAALASWMPEP